MCEKHVQASAFTAFHSDHATISNTFRQPYFQTPLTVTQLFLKWASDP